ncbi:MAG: homoserine O-acetyltransferase [Gammaproteobacteria bacterium]|nr:homoserine O-acetyltransferase [Gammaproteobacteria bacterium]
MSDARVFYQHHEPFCMRRGGQLEQVELAFETWGELDAEHSNAVLIFTGLSPSAHASSSAADPSAGWWEDMVGPGRPVNTDHNFVVCFNSLGSCFGSTGPASINAASGQPYGLDFPVLSLEDIAHCGALILDHLQITQLRCAIGPSMGGMTALAFCLLYPQRARHLISISAASRALPFAIALRSLQREIICSDPDWHHGKYPQEEHPVTGMKLARKLGMISYRSALEWEHRFGRERVEQAGHTDYMFTAEFEIESYLSAHAAKFSGSFDPNCYLYLSRAMDLYDAADHGGSLRASFAHLQLQSALVIGVTTDILFPPHQQRELAGLLTDEGIDVSLQLLNSIQGHDSFLVDMDRFRPVMADYLCKLDSGSPCDQSY